MNTKIGFLFPGQGSQIPGMGKEIVEHYPEARTFFEQADLLFGDKLSDICFYGSAEVLQQTEIAQPALLTVSAAICEVLENKGVKPDFLAGHSLGEYTALVCAGVLSFKDAFRLVKLRGELMAHAGEKCPGTMVAVIGAEKKELETYCREYAEDNTVVIANYNTSNQLVISGATDKVTGFAELMQQKGFKTLPLKVSGAFHSPLMKPALEELVEAIEQTEFKDARIPIITNTDSTPTRIGRRFKDKLKWQLICPVLWEDSINMMINHRVTTFIEVGPQRILTKMTKRINRVVKTFNVEDNISLEKLLAQKDSLVQTM